jgi:hypothetical protein
MKTITKTEALDYIAKNIGVQSIVFGIRGDSFVPVKKFRKSWNQPDGIKTTLKNGVCALLITQYGCQDFVPENLDNEVRAAQSYGEHIFLLEGTSHYDGNDEHHGLREICIRDHKIVAEIIV